MLSLSSTALSFTGPTALPRAGLATRTRPVFANENEREPEEGWNVDNLMGMMDDTTGAAMHADARWSTVSSDAYGRHASLAVTWRRVAVTWRARRVVLLVHSQA